MISRPIIGETISQNAVKLLLTAGEGDNNRKPRMLGIESRLKSPTPMARPWDIFNRKADRAGTAP